MNFLSVKATAVGGGVFQVEWQWKTRSSKAAKAGKFNVFVPPHQEEGRALAELRGIYHLLEERRVHGGSLGKGMVIEQSFSSIRKALLKSSLKKRGAGKTDKIAVALGSEFLATKYFQVEVRARVKDKVFEYSSYEESDEILPWTDLRARLHLPAIGDSVAITRHAMLRKIARIDLGILNKLDEDDLTHVPDDAFERTWRWFKKLLPNDRLTECFVRPGGRTPEKYRNTRYFVFNDDASRPVFVIDRDHTGYYLSTILRFAQATFLERLPVMAGQKIIAGLNHERKK